MFGRRHEEKDGGTPDQEDDELVRDVDVDRVLETDIRSVENVVERYLTTSTDELREKLLAELERLDDWVALGDAYLARFSLPGALQSQVIGATTLSPVAEEVPSPEFEAQIALVKAAKQEVLRHTPETLAELRAAAEELATFRQ